MAKRRYASQDMERSGRLGNRVYDSASERGDGMVRENTSNHANLPKDVIMREYPMEDDGASFPMLDDTIRASDERMRENRAMMRKNRGRGDLKW